MKGNLNNHIGVPLSLARLSVCQYAVFELGMSDVGEIASLAKQVKPDVAVITNVGPVHLAAFESIDKIAQAKAEIFSGMTTSQGIAVLNRDDPSFSCLSDEAHTRGIKNILSFGTSPQADARLQDCTMDSNGTDVVAQINGKVLRYRLSMPGYHWVINSLAILLSVLAVGADIQSAAEAMAKQFPVKGRGMRYVLDLPQGNKALLIDDSYNASPMSVKAALEVLKQINPEPGGRRIVVLGDMLELGSQAREFHLNLKTLILKASINRVFCCGPMMEDMYKTLPLFLQAGVMPDSEALIPLILNELRQGDVILVKGSHESKVNKVIDALLNIHNPKKEVDPNP